MLSKNRKVLSKCPFCVRLLMVSKVSCRELFVHPPRHGQEERIHVSTPRHGQEECVHVSTPRHGQEKVPEVSKL